MIKRTWDYLSDRFGTSLLHPQYLIKKHSQRAIEKALFFAKGQLLDVGCGRMPYRSLFEKKVTKYIGLDHPDSSKLYTNRKYKPDILADALHIPLGNHLFDIVLLLEVMEHIPYPLQVLQEIRRVMKKDGKLIISIPFMYPIHDAGYDFARYTDTMLRSLLRDGGFEIITLEASGTFFDFWFISLIVYLLKAAKESTLVIKILLLLITIPIYLAANTASFLFSPLVNILVKHPNYFPLNYTIIASPNLKKRPSGKHKREIPEKQYHSRILSDD